MYITFCWRHNSNEVEHRDIDFGDHTPRIGESVSITYDNNGTEFMLGGTVDKLEYHYNQYTRTIHKEIILSPWEHFPTVNR